MMSAERLLDWAVRLLPGEDQERYQQEFSTDLAYIPAEERMSYALRVLLCAPALRWSLRSSTTMAWRVLVACVGVLVMVGAGTVAYGIRQEQLISSPMAIAQAAGPAPGIGWTYVPEPAKPHANEPWTTTVVATKSVLVTSGRAAVTAVDPATGRELWRRPHAELGMKEPTTIEAVEGTEMVVTGDYVRGHVPEERPADGRIVDARTGQVITTPQTVTLSKKDVVVVQPDGVLTMTEEASDQSCGRAHVTLRDFNGTQKWKTVLNAKLNIAQTVSAGGRLFTGADNITPPHGRNSLGDYSAVGVVDAATGEVMADSYCQGERYWPVAGGGTVATVAAAEGGKARMGDGPLWDYRGQLFSSGGMAFVQQGEDVQGGHSIRRVDPRTGAPLWAHDLPSDHEQVLGETVATLHTPKPGGPTTLRVVDAATGEVRKAHGLDFQAESMIADATTVYVWQRHDDSDLVPDPLEVAAFDKVTGERVWNTTFSRGAQLRIVNGQLVLSDRLTGALYGLK